LDAVEDFEKTGRGPLESASADADGDQCNKSTPTPEEEQPFNIGPIDWGGGMGRTTMTRTMWTALKESNMVLSS
jgi:hypothetical protein